MKRLILYSAIGALLCGCRRHQADVERACTSPFDHIKGSWVDYDYPIFGNFRVKFYEFTPYGAHNNSDQFITWSGPINSYALNCPDKDIEIDKAIYYVKTFGGSYPVVSVNLVNERYVCYPETIKGSHTPEGFPDDRFNTMKAVTHVYDLDTGKRFKSQEYEYDHNVPLILPKSFFKELSK